MSLIKKDDTKIFRCSVHKSEKKSIRTGSFLSNSKLKLETFILIVYTWSRKIPVKAAVDVIGVSEVTIIQWYQYIRDVTSHHLLNNAYQIGGVGHIVEIDETLMCKRKHSVGRLPVQRWVFGGYDRQDKIGFLVFVNDRTKETLLPMIRKYIKPGTTIYSDCWAAYSGIRDLNVQPPYEHFTVNHRHNFVDPITQVHTNTVECYWKNAKRKFKTMMGIQSSMVESHLDEFMWSEIYGKTFQDRFDNVLLHISQWRPQT